MNALTAVIASIVLTVPASLLAQPASPSDAPAADEQLAKQIFETMIHLPGNNPPARLVHAKGIVCHGTFAPTSEAAALSKAAHFQAESVPVVVRFSQGAPDPVVPDNAPYAGPQGMAIRFTLSSGDTDIVANSHNGFVVSDGKEFLTLQKAVVATDPSKPHPWPIEQFLATHATAAKFVQDVRRVPASFANEAFLANNAFIFLNKDGTSQPGRYKIIPVAGEQHLSDDDAKAKSPNFLIDDLKSRLATGALKYQLVVQLPNPGDVTKDPSVVWPDDRKTVTVGTIAITSVDPNSDQAQKELAFDPTNLTDGIELSDDPFPSLRSLVYAMSVKRRQGHD